MKFRFKNKRIDGISVALPETEVVFEDEVSNYNFLISKTRLAMPELWCNNVNEEV